MLSALEFDKVVAGVQKSLQAMAVNMGVVDLAKCTRTSGTLAFPAIVLVLSFCVDCAASNLLAIRKVIARYKRFNATNGVGIVTLIIMTRCLAHQVHLCSKSCWGMLGTNIRLAASRAEFIGGLIGACRTFNQANYFTQIAQTAITRHAYHIPAAVAAVCPSFDQYVDSIFVGCDLQGFYVWCFLV
jgi:hypothetical protein